MIKFDKLFQTLKENGISQYSLYTRHGISRSQIQRLKNNESVTTHTLNMILNILGEGFSLNDIAEFTPDTEQTYHAALPAGSNDSWLREHCKAP